MNPGKAPPVLDVSLELIGASGEVVIQVWLCYIEEFWMDLECQLNGP